MLEAIERSDVIKRGSGIGQRPGEVAALDFDSVKAEKFVVEIAAAEVEAFGDEPCGQGAFAGGAIEKAAARKRFENFQDGFVEAGTRHAFRSAIAGEQRWMVGPLDGTRLSCGGRFGCSQTWLLWLLRCANT